MYIFRTYSCLFALFVFGPLCLAQSGSQIDLDANNIRARFNSNGQLFWDGNFSPKFEVPKVSSGSGNFPKHAFSLSSLWFYAIDSTGDTLMAVQQYGQNGTDFGMGALPPGAGIGFGAMHTGIWKLDIHTEQSYEEWPTSYTYNGSQYTLEPYLDNNKNGRYDSTTGDQPFFYGEQQVSFVYHDMVPHPITQTKPIGLQIFVDGFAISSNDKRVNETIFIRYKVVSQNQDLKSFRMGLYADFDLGNYSDDMVGTDTARNMIYAYNGDEDDEGILGYGLNPPAVGVVFANQPLCLSCFHSNVPVWKDSTSAFRNPEKAQHFRNIMEGLNTKGDTLVATGPGIQTGMKSPYAFTGNPINNTGWTMGTDTFDAADFRMIGITGKDSLLRGDTFELLVAYVYARTNSGGSRGGVGELQSRVDWLRQHLLGKKPDIQNDCFKLGPTSEDSSSTSFRLPESKSLWVYPNPGSGTFLVQTQEVIAYQITNPLGQAIRNGSFSAGQNQLLLNELPNGVYFLQAFSDGTTSYETLRLIIQK